VIEALHDVARARAAPGLLRAFNDAGVLAPADVHVARRLATLSGGVAPEVALAVALAVRAPRLGHVYVDLATVRDTAAVERDEPVDLSALPWPDPAPWPDAVAASGLAAGGEEDSDRPLRLAGTCLYLDRYWREERRLADDLRVLGAAPARGIDEDLLAAGLARLFAGFDDRQRLAAAVAVLRRFAVVAGGPGTGKTTIVGRILALLAEQAAARGAAAPLVALAAPTGKAAARLQEAVHAAAAGLPVNAEIRARLQALDGYTLHRLLGARRAGAFAHHRSNRLPHDVIVVDETSMVSLWLMSRLVEAVRPEARLVLVGDPGQLTSIEAGAVLGDIVGPAVRGLRMSGPARERLAGVARVPVPAASGPAAGDGIVVLDRVHRYGEGIAALADALRRGDADAVMATLTAAPEGVTWIGDPDSERALAPIRAAAVAAGTALVAAAETGDAPAALARLGAFRLLCAHRRGAHGVAAWTARIEAWLAETLDGFAAAGPWYPGRPLLVTENDYGLRLFNGDMGVVVATEPERVRAVFDRGGETHAVVRSRLEGVETAYAMTVHKSQGSQFATAAVVLPPPGSRILTRELLYTAVTRARDRLILAGTEEAVRAAAERPAARASGLRRRLWDASSR
jgi:exodeoxyribonuclease V alpha subunit